MFLGNLLFHFLEDLTFAQFNIYTTTPTVQQSGTYIHAFLNYNLVYDLSFYH